MVSQSKPKTTPTKSTLNKILLIKKEVLHLLVAESDEEIAAAIERIQGDSDYRMELIARGRRRVSALPSPEAWARAYFDVFRQVIEH